MCVNTHICIYIGGRTGERAQLRIWLRLSWSWRRVSRSCAFPSERSVGMRVSCPVRCARVAGQKGGSGRSELKGFECVVLWICNMHESQLSGGGHTYGVSRCG